MTLCRKATVEPSRTVRRERLRELLAELGLAEKANQRGDTLSGGELFVTSGVIFGQGKGVINIDGGTLSLGNDATANVHTMAQINVGQTAASVGTFVLHDGQVLYNTFYETI